MKYLTLKKSGLSAIAIAVALTAVPSMNAPLLAQVQTVEKVLTLSVGEGTQINLDSAISDVFIANPAIADVEVKSARQLYLFGIAPGDTTFYATNASGKTIYKTTIRVSNNINSLSQMLSLAMPEAKINITTLNGITLLTGTVAQPQDAEEAERLVAAFAGEGSQIVSRLKTATPLQVNLQVRIAEVGRSLAKVLSTNFQGRDLQGTGTLFGTSRGRNTGSISLDENGNTLFNVQSSGDNNNTLDLAGRFLGLDFIAALDASEDAGFVNTLASPSLTAVSGQTGQFLAGGSFPIPVASGLGATSVEFRDFGVQLSYTPIVLSDGRISIQLRTEVSDISTQGAVILNGFQIPAITTRSAETTVELGSGESFMIAGLLTNTANSSISKIPGIGDVPILGSLFKSDNWQKNQTELMIVITPYLVKPVNANQIKLPTDGFESPSDLSRIFLGKENGGDGNTPRPEPKVAPGVPVAPSISSVKSDDKKDKRSAKNNKNQESNSETAPGFSFGG